MPKATNHAAAAMHADLKAWRLPEDFVARVRHHDQQVTSRASAQP
jgi:hypothetical protein